VGEWGAHTLRNVTYLTRDLTHEGGGHQHLNKAFSSSNNSNNSHAGHNHHRGNYSNGDEVHVVQAGGADAHRHDYYDLSFLASLNEEDKVTL
jgi:hypothetical protein